MYGSCCLSVPESKGGRPIRPGKIACTNRVTLVFGVWGPPGCLIGPKPLDSAGVAEEAIQRSLLCPRPKGTLGQCYMITYVKHDGDAYHRPRSEE